MATAYKDFLLSEETGDLDFSDKEMKIVITNQMSLRQRIYLRFSIWGGDWYFDELFGFPYRTFVAKKTMKSVLDGRIKSEVRLEPDVMEIIDFTSSMNVSMRTYSCFFTVLTVEGVELNLAFQGSDRFIYPTPSEGNAQLCGDPQSTLVYGNKKYSVINFAIPSYSN